MKKTILLVLSILATTTLCTCAGGAASAPVHNNKQNQNSNKTNTGHDVVLNDYLVFTDSGYNGFGISTCKIDTVRFEKEVESKIVMDEDFAKKTMSGTHVSNSSLLLNSCTDAEYNPGDELSNGDKTTLTWHCDTDLAKSAFGVNLICNDAHHTVEGLDDPETFDLIDYFDEIKISGRNGAGKILLKNKGFSSLQFEIKDNGTFSNGDTATITLVTPEKPIVQTMGKRPSSTSFTVTVEGLTDYVSSVNDIPQNSLDELIKEATDKITAVTNSSRYDDGVSATSIEYIGNFILCRKDLDSGTTKNYFIPVYKVVAEEDAELKDGTTTHMEYPYYSTVQISNVILKNNTVEYEKLERCNDWFEFESGIKGKYGEIKHGFDGYESLDDLKAAINARAEKFDIEDNVN